VTDTMLCTRIENEVCHVPRPSSHIMAAPRGLRHSRTPWSKWMALKVPILCSPAVFVAALLDRACKSWTPRSVSSCFLTTHPSAQRRCICPPRPPQTAWMRFHIVSPDEAIGTQNKEMTLANGSSCARSCATARTFCRQADVAAMRAQRSGFWRQPTRTPLSVEGGAKCLAPRLAPCR